MFHKKSGLKIFLISSSLLFLVFSCTRRVVPNDLLIKNVKIVDGTGKPSYKGSIAIKGEKIVKVGKFKGRGEIEIDGSGLYACPGFIDPHNHSDFSIIQYPLAENLIMQGITTVLAGNCGSSPAPQKGLPFRDFLSRVEEKGISLNLALLAGHNTIRVAVMGEDFKRRATPKEIEEMKALLEEAMGSGAFGLSSFFDPSPGEYASLDEIVELAKVAAKYKGIYVPHTRHIQSQMPSSDPEEYGYGIFHGDIQDVWVGRYRGYKEAIEISRRAEIPLHIAHFCTAFKNPMPHPNYLDEAGARATLEEIIDKAREEGLSITFDVIACSSTISAPRPIWADFYKGRNLHLEWVNNLEFSEFVEKLKSREFRDKIREVYDSNRLKLGMIHTKEDPYWMDCFQITSCENKEYEGKILGDLARERGIDPLELIFDLIVEDPKATWVQFLDRRDPPGAMPPLLKHPCAMPSTDVTAFPAELSPGQWNPYSDYGSLPAPTAYGLFPHYIGTYVRELGVLSIEEAVKKATSFVAEKFGFESRGVLKPGAYADIVIFNLGTIKMSGDFLKPNTPPEGIEYVLVNGKIVYKEKRHTGLKPGKVLRHST